MQARVGKQEGGSQNEADVVRDLVGCQVREAGNDRCMRAPALSDTERVYLGRSAYPIPIKLTLYNPPILLPINPS
ncbi:hypothetical protein Pmani_016087 [Petrolisthes manimaculis]|uniref:Uncharacterized protein n=1 Tax=Petrolisthes manimaculis TaxID=1843537 RepID=A0AAE1PPR0_9EUCA|nr:hypothetical protein Pmani_016087 [Petrolisthes manimaculis]